MTSKATQIESSGETTPNGGDIDPVRLARLNDYAEIMIWGSNGRNVYTFDNPNNNFLLLATKDNPMKGILELVQEEPPSLRDKSQTERDQATKERAQIAETYESGILAFVESGKELIEAKENMDKMIKGLPLPRRPHRVLLQKELREKRRAIYLANGGELPFEDSDLSEEIKFVNYQKAPKPEDVDASEYDLIPEWSSFMRSNVLDAFGDEWLKKDMESGLIGVTYRIHDVNDGTKAKADPGWLQSAPQMPYTPFYPGDRSQWHTF